MVSVAESDQSLMNLEGADRLTFGGQIALSGVTPHTERDIRLSTLAGARVQVRVPPSWEVRSVSAWTRFEHQGARLGFQRAPRGSSLLQLLVNADRVHPDTLVSMRGGTLAHYILDWGAESVAGFTLWQGPASDVFTFDHTTFDEAVDAFVRFSPRDGRRGAVLDQPRDCSLQNDEATIDCGSLVLNVVRRDANTVPPWPGAQGANVELYRMEDFGGRVLAAGSSAVAIVGRDSDNGPVTDAEIGELSHGLLLDWT